MSGAIAFLCRQRAFLLSGLPTRTPAGRCGGGMSAASRSISSRSVSRKLRRLRLRDVLRQDTYTGSPTRTWPVVPIKPYTPTFWSACRTTVRRIVVSDFNCG